MSQQPERHAGESVGDTAVEARGSFEDYARVRQAGLIRFGFLLVRDHQLAQDLAQEGLARLHGRWAELSAESNPDAYVRKIMVNQLLSWRRKRSWTERPVEQVRDEAATDPMSSVGEREAMWRLLGDLPLRQRAVVVLRYYEDLDDAAIGRILGCTASTVATHATRALDRLRMVVELADTSPRTP